MKLFFIPLLLLLCACANSTSDSDGENDIDKKEIIVETIDQIITRQIESALRIPATEKYSYEVFESDINGDGITDRVITVNQLEKAINEAIESSNTAKRAELGYIGSYNHFFFMDGATNEISSAIPVPSSPHAKLKIGFENITSEDFKDVTVDFRIRNSCFRRFFTSVNNVPRQTFEQKLFDGLGDKKREAFVIRYQKGTYSLARDILIYKATLEEIEITDPSDVYNIDPKISPTNELERHWFYNASERKYFTKKVD